MQPHRKAVRTALRQACRYDFDALLHEAKLTPREREIIVLRYLEDLKNYQIAMQLNVSPETVRNDLASSAEKLNQALNLLRATKKWIII
jgi:RNA polymerase sigma factor (sigma-70 family)